MRQLAFFRILTLGVILLALNACTTSTESVTETPPTLSASPNPETSDMPSAPWVIIFADASGNVFRFQQPSMEANAEFKYTPVTPEMSSSGTYSGGEAGSGELTPTQTQEIWSQMVAMRDDSALHVEKRMMGTGSFRTEEQEVRHDFIVGSGLELSAFTALVAPLRKP